MFKTNSLKLKTSVFLNKFSLFILNFRVKNKTHEFLNKTLWIEIKHMSFQTLHISRDLDKTVLFLNKSHEFLNKFSNFK